MARGTPHLHLPFVALALATLAACAPADAPGGALPAGSYAAQERALAGAVNDHRASLRLPPLRWDAALADVARAHSRAMASGRVPFGHRGFEARMVQARHLGYTSMAENLGTNSYDSRSTAQVAMSGFLRSPPHRHAIEGPYARTGVGVARDSAGDFYFTQIFAR